MRAHFVDTVQAVSPTGSLVLLSGATVTVVTQGTSTPVSATLYAHDDSVDNATKANPFTTGGDGTVDFYLTTAARVDLLLTKTGYTTVRRTVDVSNPSSGGGSSGPLQSKATTLNAAALLALDTVAVDLMGADPAEGMTAVPVAAWLENDDGGTDYTTSANLWIGYANDPLGDGTVILIPAVRINSATFPLYFAAQGGGQAFPAACKGQRLVLMATGPLTGGTKTAKLTLLWAQA
jgi:hypothetical protein